MRQYASQGVCAYEPVFGKRPGSAPIVECVLIRKNTVVSYLRDELGGKKLRTVKTVETLDKPLD